MINEKDVCIKIIDVLIEFANKKQTLTYTELSQKIDFDYSPLLLGPYLDKISRFTYRYEDGICITALVGKKEEKTENGEPMPGNGFFSMYNDLNNFIDDYNKSECAKEERERIFAHNWSNLKERMKKQFN